MCGHSTPDPHSPEAGGELDEIATEEGAEGDSQGAPRFLEADIDTVFLNMSHHRCLIEHEGCSEEYPAKNNKLRYVSNTAPNIFNLT